MRHPILLPSIATLAAAASLAAQTAFPLPASASSTTATENTAPFVAPFRMTQTKVIDRNTLMQAGLPASMVNFDMSTFDTTGRYIFTPAEVSSRGGGVFRYDTQTGMVAVLAHGNNTGVRTADPIGWSAANDDFARCDPCTLTPWNTILWGEETTGGRLFEILNPLSPTGPFQVVWRTSIPAVAHEGVRLDSHGNLYFVDEDNSGCIYKFVPTTPGDLSAGQSFVLSVDAYATDPNAAPNESWNSTANRLTNRFGPAHWVPMTDAAGTPLTTTNPFVYVTANSGRIAADELLGTPYGRPEDLDFNRLANGNECLYVAITSETRVISIELTGADTATVREFVNFDTINLATGSDVNPAQNDPYAGTGSGTVLSNPDNIAVDHWGNVYVIEDDEPGDVWKCVDADKDGVAEAMGLFITLGVGGAEPTGLIFDPVDPYRFIVNVQHPSSGNDATWSFRTRPYAGSNQDLALRTGTNTTPTTGPGEFVKTAQPWDVVGIQLDSPNGGLYGVPFAVLLQGFATGPGAVPFLPPLWINPRLPILTVTGGPTGQFLTVLPHGGFAVGMLVPPGLAGLSVMVQGIGVSHGMLVLSDAHEVVLK